MSIEAIRELETLASVCPELNMANYTEDDVRHLNDWAIEMSLLAEKVAAIQQAEAQQPSSKEHLFELWWEAHMPNATQEQAWTAFTAAVASNGVGIAAQQPATGEPVAQAGLTDDQLREAFAEKSLGMNPNEHDMTIFALGAEVGAGELAAERQMARMYFDERNSARDAWRRAADERDQFKATTEPVLATVRNLLLELLNEPDRTLQQRPDRFRRVREAYELLYNHPAPSVRADVVRDAERWREVERASCDVTLRLHNTRSGLRSTVIDAAMLAAKEGGAA